MVQGPANPRAKAGLCVEMKFYWRRTMPICLPIPALCFDGRAEYLPRRAYVLHSLNIYYPAFTRTSLLPTPPPPAKDVIAT